MFTDITLSVPAAIMALLPDVISFADLLLKSALLIALTAGALYCSRKFFKSSGRHLFWANAILSIALLPFLPQFSSLGADPVDAATSPLQSAPAFELITLSAVATEAPDVTLASPATNEFLQYLPLILLALYLLPCIYLLGRLGYSAWFIWRVRTHSSAESDLELVIRLHHLKQHFDVSRPVVLKFSEHVESPISFGLFRPEIVFPESARHWPKRVFESALLHEFAHIQRLDWLTSAVAYIICCINWINPLVWFAWRQLNQEAENACDSAVVQTGVCEDDYAEDLLTVTRSCKDPGRYELLAQSVFGTGTLKQRVELLLSRDKELRPQSPATRVVLVLGSAVLLTLFSSSTVIGVQALTAIDISGNKSLSSLWQDYREFENSLQNPGLQSSTANRRHVDEESLEEFGAIASVAPLATQLPLSPFSPLAPGRLAADSPAALGYTQAKRVSDPGFEMSQISIGDLRPIASVSHYSLDESLIEPQGSAKPFLITTRMTRPEEMSRAELSDEIERVESYFYNEYNKLTADKQLHVHCARYRPSNSLIKRWACEPRFITDERSETLREGMQRMFFNTAVGGSELRRNTRAEREALTSALQSAMLKDNDLAALYVYLEALRAQR